MSSWALVNDMGGAAMLASVIVGEELGLYRAMADGEPVTAEELAAKTQCNPRLTREWLNAQAASGYVELRRDGTLRAAAGAGDGAGRRGLAGLRRRRRRRAGRMFIDKDKIVDAYRAATARSRWGDHHPCLFSGTERFFRPGYRANLVPAWLPALDGVVDKLERGAQGRRRRLRPRRVDDGDGAGVSRSSRVLRLRLPRAVDRDGARSAPREAGVADRVHVRGRQRQGLPGARLRPGLLLRLPARHGRSGRRRARTRARRSSRTAPCCWSSRSPTTRWRTNMQPGRPDVLRGVDVRSARRTRCRRRSGSALGAQAGEARLREVFIDAGFTRFRRATETPFNLVLEARP